MTDRIQNGLQIEILKKKKILFPIEIANRIIFMQKFLQFVEYFIYILVC